ncbi:MAG: phospholipase D-like domain-containing protein [Bacteroidota bacterium]|nr:phospholipase D-like domain-containing protein [Bacteroidota bacterium]
MFVTSSKNNFSVKAYRGDAKTLLAFNMPHADAQDLAGFTILCTPKGKPAYYLYNALQFADAKQHFQEAKEPAFSSINAPFQKFQWLHVPGQFHQGEKIFYGAYDYTVTPRYFKEGKLQQLDTKRSVSVAIDVASFSKKAIEVGFTRGFVQSQAFVHRFGASALISPKNAKDAFFNTGDPAGNIKEKSFSFKDEYIWSGFSAREKVFGILEEATKDKSLSLCIFAYDLYEPDFSAQVLQLAKEGRVRMILDDAKLHHDASGDLVEDQFETQFKKVAKAGAGIKRGKFGRFSHHKVIVVIKGNAAQKVLTGSTNFSITGMYVNSNHVIIFNDPSLAQTYADVFNESWNDNVSEAFTKSTFANKTFSFKSTTVPQMEINFSPHSPAFAEAELKKMADRVLAEKRSVLFAVMDVTGGTGPLLPALQTLHASGKVFSFGISDSPEKDLTLYKPGVATGILVSGKIAGTLPPPFDKEKSIGIGHQIHHKFIVCNFNGSDAVVYCGSSNLALLGEEQNGDNLLTIFDTDIATVFAIEAISLVDHFNFRNAFGSNNHPANNKIVSNDGQPEQIVHIPSGDSATTTAVQSKTGLAENATVVHSKSVSPPKAEIKKGQDKNASVVGGKNNSTPDATVKPTKATSTFRPMTLTPDSNWTDSYFSEHDTHCQERALLA